MVFEAVEIFVAFAAGVALVGFVFFHAEGAGEGFEGFGIDDAEGPVAVCVEGLRVMAVLSGVSLLCGG